MKPNKYTYWLTQNGVERRYSAEYRRFIFMRDKMRFLKVFWWVLLFTLSVALNAFVYWWLIPFIIFPAVSMLLKWEVKEDFEDNFKETINQN